MLDAARPSGGGVGLSVMNVHGRPDAEESLVAVMCAIACTHALDAGVTQGLVMTRDLAACRISLRRQHSDNEMRKADALNDIQCHARALTR